MTSPSDRIILRELRLRCIIGTLPAERLAPQEVLATVVLRCDLAAAGASDDLADTIDYATLHDRIVTLAEGSSFQLLEALAESIASLCLAIPAVAAVTVTLDKPGALRQARSVAVELIRHKPGA
jgi:FolB domain-containing protein